MLNEFDQYLDEHHLGNKVRAARKNWNASVKDRTPIAVKQCRQWKPALAYCRYADDFIIIVKGTKADAEKIREECREVLEDKLKLKLSMDKTHITHINDGFIFLGHRLIRKRSGRGHMRVVTTIPREKARDFAASLCASLSGDYSDSSIDKVLSINRRLTGWANFYQFVGYRAKVFSRIDHVVFWKLAHWLARKHRSRIKPVLRRWFKRPAPGSAKTFVLFGKTSRGLPGYASLVRLAGRPKQQFRYQSPVENPYLGTEDRSTFTSDYNDVVMALGRA